MEKYIFTFQDNIHMNDNADYKKENLKVRFKSK